MNTVLSIPYFILKYLVKPFPACLLGYGPCFVYLLHFVSILLLPKVALIIFMFAGVNRLCGRFPIWRISSSRFCSTSVVEDLCGTCNIPLSNIFICSTCDRMILPKKQDYFSLFELKPMFSLSHNALIEGYGKVTKVAEQRQDKKHSVSDTEELDTFMSEVTKAFKTLESPISRAKFLYELRWETPSVYTPDPNFFSMISNLQIAVVNAKEEDEKQLTGILEYATSAALQYRTNIAKEFEKEDINTKELGFMIGRLEWTFRLMEEVGEKLSTFQTKE